MKQPNRNSALSPFQNAKCSIVNVSVRLWHTPAKSLVCLRTFIANNLAKYYASVTSVHKV